MYSNLPLPSISLDSLSLEYYHLSDGETLSFRRTPYDPNVLHPPIPFPFP